MIDGSYPVGLSDERDRMMAASADFLYVITNRGSVLDRIPVALSRNDRPHWPLVNLPDSERPLDIRQRESEIFAASSDGDIFRRLPSEGWQKQ